MTWSQFRRKSNFWGHDWIGFPSFWLVLSIDRDGEACIEENPNLTGSLD